MDVALEIVGGKWKSSILYHLNTGKKRTHELRKLIRDITPKVLTQQLRELEKDGIIHRIVHYEIPPKVEYEISEYGLSLKTVLESFCSWGESHMEKLYGDRSVFLEK
ncbi:winged helix-turn-helix transcriptional regulator [Paenibacillus sp. NPDC058177]|uniref:winged helix-turn-helix transcriptional regulator n=1 Tax=Paenibacillus sp. NPDC058177 TaxID=3346369 RepID=UPI0036D9451C